MIEGLGNDIIEIQRVRSSIEEHGLHFTNRLFSEKEQAYCNHFKDAAPHFAGRFAAKEAIAKALGTGIGKDLGWHDMEIINDEKGKPIVHFSEAARKKHGAIRVLISISHSTHYATAVAIAIKHP